MESDELITSRLSHPDSPISTAHYPLLNLGICLGDSADCRHDGAALCSSLVAKSPNTLSWWVSAVVKRLTAYRQVTPAVFRARISTKFQATKGSDLHHSH
jgi:hypothetical protein